MRFASPRLSIHGKDGPLSEGRVGYGRPLFLPLRKGSKLVEPLEHIDRQTMIDSVDHVIRERRTWKVLSKALMEQAEPPVSSDSDEDGRKQAASSDESRALEIARLVEESIEIAGWAPFHFDRSIDEIAEPWRFHRAGRASCRQLARRLPEWAVDMKPGNKMPAMLDACAEMILVTWLPETLLENQQKQLEVNEEHLAAAAAAVQNLLLALEARGLGTYWSSGGVLRQSDVGKALGIQERERLIAAVLIDGSPNDPQRDVMRVPGKNRPKRSAPEKWCRTLEIE